MNIDEAIKSLESILMNHGGLYSRRGEDALQLGIEALLRLKEGRRVDHAFASVKLPTEREKKNN